MSSKEFFFSSANAWFGLAVTPASFGPCSTFALANAGSDRASALPAPSLRNSRRRTYSDLGVTSDQRMRDLRGDRTPPARAWLRFRGFRLAHDGRDCRRQRLRLLGRGRRRSAPLPRVPALPSRALFLRAQLRAVLIADEPDPRAARAVQASFDTAAHVQRAPRPRRLRRKADDPLRRDRRGKLAFRREPAIAFEDALLFRRGELARVVLAEPAVARACARLSAAGDWTQSPGAPAVEMDARTATHLDAGQGRGHLLFHLARDDGGQFAREPVDDGAKRRIPCLICHAIVPYSQISAAKAWRAPSFLSRVAAQCERKQQLLAEQALQPVLCLFLQLLAFRLRFRLRALLRLVLHLPCLLLHALLRLRRIDAERAPEQRRTPFFDDLVHGRFQVELRCRRVPGRTDELEIDGDRIRRLHLPAGERGDGGRRERYRSGPIERAVA